MSEITVLIPVGPEACYKQWLPEALASVFQQTLLPQEILLIDDGADLTISYLDSLFGEANYLQGDLGDVEYLWHRAGELVHIRCWKAPFHIGFSSAFNCGMGLSTNPLIAYLAADDRMLPTCLENCYKTYEDNSGRDGWYACSYQIGEQVHTIPINIAMITKNLWNWLGGYPSSAFAGPDALLLSILMVHAPDRIIKVKDGTPLYWLREHPDQETHRQASYFLDEMNSIRNKETLRFKPNPKVTLK